MFCAVMHRCAWLFWNLQNVPELFKIYKMCLECPPPRLRQCCLSVSFKMRNGCLDRGERERERERGASLLSVSVHLNARSSHASVHVHTAAHVCPQQQTILNRLCWGREPVANTLAMFLCNTVMWPFRLFLWQSRRGQAGISFNIIGFILPST